jgi:molybdopterin biosynthesis enzyme
MRTRTHAHTHTHTLAQIGLLASLGVARVHVHSEPSVALLSTGDELVDMASPTPVLAYGQIRDSNRPMLLGALRDKGVQGVRDLGIVGDHHTSLKDHLMRGITSDILITSGGVSMGVYGCARYVCV